MTEPVVLLNVDTRGVATITLNRPKVNNAYNGEVIEAMIDAVGECASNKDIRVLVIKGNGKHFQAGADLKWLKDEIFRPETNDGVPKCTGCKTGVVRPNIVFFGESLPNR